jgi:hypothetical protein
MTETEIKAELYDLRSHVCDGRLTLRPDGKRDPGDRPCRGCARRLKLVDMLLDRSRRADSGHGGGA